VDKWLTESLKSKTPILFLPHEDWLTNVLKFWDQVIAPAELEKARKASIQVPVEKVQEQPTPIQKPEQRRGDPVNPMSELRKIDQEREVEEAARAESERRSIFANWHDGIYGRGR
jgi:hypothetical protein